MEGDKVLRSLNIELFKNGKIFVIKIRKRRSEVLRVFVAKEGKICQFSKGAPPSVLFESNEIYGLLTSSLKQKKAVGFGNEEKTNGKA